MFSKKPSKRGKKGRNRTFLDVQTQRADPPKPLSENVSIAFILACILALLFWFGWFGVKGIARTAYHQNERYLIVAGHIQFSTSPGGILNASRALAIADIDPAGNLFDFDLQAARERLLGMPAVAEASVRRHLPDGIEIRVTEHTGVAQLPGPRPLLVAEDGLIIRSAMSASEAELPVIAGIKSPNSKTGLNLRSSNASDGLRVINHVRRSPFLSNYLAVKHVDVSDPESLTVQLADKKRILLPRNRLTGGLNRAAQFLDEGLRDRKINVLDFTSGKLFVRYE